VEEEFRELDEQLASISIFEHIMDEIREIVKAHVERWHERERI
jgi:hypothetical protein